MPRIPHFKFYVDDFVGGTSHLTDEELGCYLRLLLAQFNRGGSLPMDKKFLARFTLTVDKNWDVLREKFKDNPDGTISNQRLLNEMIKAQNFTAKQNQNGALGGRPKKVRRNPEETQNDNLTNPTETQIKPNGNPNKSQHKPRDNPDGSQEEPKNNIWVNSGLTQTKPFLGNGNGNGNGNQEGIAKGGSFVSPIGPAMVEIFRVGFPNYPIDQELDFRACIDIAGKIADWQGWPKSSIVDVNLANILALWEKVVFFAKTDDWYSGRCISDFNKEFQRLIQKYGKEKRNSVNRGHAGKGATNGFDPTRIEVEGPGNL